MVDGYYHAPAPRPRHDTTRHDENKRAFTSTVSLQTGKIFPSLNPKDTVFVVGRRWRIDVNSSMWKPYKNIVSCRAV
jgi:hypothetical protein